MLLRTVVLLLSLSVVMCATLGHYQAQAKEEEKAPVAVEPAAVNVGTVDAVDSVDEAEVEVKVPTDAQVSDSPATEELAANILAEDPASEADTPEMAHSDTEKTEQDHPGTEKTQVEVPDADETELDTLESDKLEVEVPVTAEEPGTDGDDESAGDTPAVEDLSAEAITTQEQQQPSDEEQKEALEEKVVEKEDEGNDIKPVQTTPTPSRTVKREEPSGGWGLNSIRSGFQGVHGYFESLVELVGGQDGVCQYRCRYGELPQPRPGYQQEEPNGCSNTLVGYEVNSAIGLDIPAMTKCCNVLDVCYDTCGVDKYDCDNEFRSCLHGICSDLNKSLGFVSKVEACESMADTLYNTVWTLGCRPYMNSQRAACICEGEERDEL